MQTKNLVQTTARIIRITELAIGNIVKMVEESSYSGATVKFAVVSDILNNGDKTFVEFVSFSKDYLKGIKLEKTTYAGDKELNLFPANKEDLLTSYQEIKEKTTKEIAEKEEELVAMKQNFDWLEKVIEKDKAQNLSAPKFEELDSPVN